MFLNARRRTLFNKDKLKTDFDSMSPLTQDLPVWTHDLAIWAKHNSRLGYLDSRLNLRLVCIDLKRDVELASLNSRLYSRDVCVDSKADLRK